MYAHQKPLTSQQTEYLKDLYYQKKMYFGRDKLFAYIRDNQPKEVPRIYKAQLAKWLAAQRVNQVTQQPKKEVSTRPTRATKKGILQIDLLEMPLYNRHKYILTAVDVFSRYAWAYPLRTKSANVVKQKIMQIMNKYPFKVIQSDNGNEFAFQIPNVTRLYSKPYAPTSQSVVERFNGTLRSMLRKYLQTANAWITVVSDLVENYNNTVHRSLKDTPANVFNYNAEQTKELNNIQEQTFKKRHKGNAEEKPLDIGTRVRVLDAKRKKAVVTNKMEPFYLDSIYNVIKVIKSNSDKFTLARFKLKNEKTGTVLPRTYNISQIQVVETVEEPPSKPRRKTNVTTEIIELREAPQASGTRRPRRSGRN